jgi:hypothetical protein
MHRFFSRILPVVLAGLLLFSCAGISRIKETVQKQSLKQKVLYAPFHNPWQEQGVVMDERFGATMRDCLGESHGQLVFVDSPALEQAVAEHHGALTGLGGLDELMEQARNEGVNAIVTGRLAHVSVQREKRGFIGMRKTVPVMRVAIHIWIYDALSGSKLLDEDLVRHIALDHEPAPNTLPAVTWSAEWEEMARTAGRMACNAMRRLEWRSFVLDTEEEMLTFGAGMDVGIVPGTGLFVIRPVVRSKGPLGQRFIFSGDNIGTIQVLETEPDKSKAGRISGGPFQPGDWVTPVR